MTRNEPKPDPNLPVPLYYQLKQIFDDKIKSGEWQPGQLIPTENELISKYEVSRTTVREGITALVHEGKLQKKQGKGTIVCAPKMEERLGRLTGFAEEMISKGLTPGAKLLEVKEMIPPKAVLENLTGGNEEHVLYIKRIRLANDEPIAIENSYWPKEIGAFFKDSNLETSAFYSILEKNGIYLRDADEIITAKTATKQEASLLGIHERDPMLRMIRTTYSTLGHAIEFTRTDYRSDLYLYRVHLKR
ncbi:GntR family transcriptional regulator [Paenibacillus allorhizosphaerae]|uniref:HTH-type transcriptional repressor NagR n=1 Tax=Paenibacillus allorhizosphaerae TaxID=2849866 RepID=A0ABM8VAB9_9BACL|nr:GntR family transcriptional regulator [Paenibacillus allorhizosphaerae]CAG7616064.1 HTH-type transcriptional repressor NagR [Paenibacillus allorhizosphaerae]